MFLLREFCRVLALLTCIRLYVKLMEEMILFQSPAEITSAAIQSNQINSKRNASTVL